MCYVLRKGLFMTTTAHSINTVVVYSDYGPRVQVKSLQVELTRSRLLLQGQVSRAMIQLSPPRLHLWRRTPVAEPVRIPLP